jgi:transcriptional regulator with XRE-family HTH domain
LLIEINLNCCFIYKTLEFESLQLVADFLLNPPDSTVWGPENEALLKSLRLRAGMDLATLARRNIVSSTQVRQLEDGGNSSFYNPSIKYALGKKLLKYLGHDLKEKVAPTVEPPIETDMPQLAASPSIVTTSKLESDENLLKNPPSKTSLGVLTLVMSGLLVCAAAWFLFDKESSVPAQAVVQSAPEVKAEPQAQVTEVTAPEKTDISKPAPQVACSWNNAEEEVQPDSPHKAAEYVHVVAQQASTVCIMDGQMRVATLNLEVGDARSIYGPAPFKVYSADLKAIKVYFQGQHIKLANQDTQQMKLTAAAYMPLKN